MFPKVLRVNMFGLFKKKEYKSFVNDEDKQWIEKNLMWFIETFGLDHLNNGAFYLPVIEVFPYTDLTKAEQFEKLFLQLCTYLNIDSGEILIDFFDDIGSLEWGTLAPQREYRTTAGRCYRVYSTKGKRFRIHIAKSQLKNYQDLISTLLHDLCRAKLLDGNYINSKDEYLESFTDLACAFFGLGIFLANSRPEYSPAGVRKPGYLPVHFIAYANACVCYIMQDDYKRYTQYLNTDTRSLFKQNCEFLANTNNTELYKRKVEELLELRGIYVETDKMFDEREFTAIIAICNLVLHRHPNNSGIMSYLAYAYLQNKEYEKAIELYTEMISQYNYWYLPYYNRGYCKLQLGDLDSAFPDLYAALQMNEEHAYIWRNLGVYYLMLGIYDKALAHLEHAEKIDPKVELINFFLSKTHGNLGNTELADELLKKSEVRNEYNDSVMV